jgi:hypothetical protein
MNAILVLAMTVLAREPTPVGVTDFASCGAIAVAGATGCVAAVTLDEAVLGGAGPDIARLRLFDSNAVETPYVLRIRRQVKQTIEEGHWDAKITGFRSLKGNCAEIEMEREAKSSRPVAVVLHSPVGNFEKVVTVEGSEDGTTWSVLCTNVPVFDYSKFVDVRSVRVGFAQSACTRFRVTVGNIQETQASPLFTLARDVRGGAPVAEHETRTFRDVIFRVDRVEFVARQDVVRAAEAVRRAYPVRDVRVTTDRKWRQTVVEVDGKGIPAVLFRVVTDDANFSREAILEGSLPIRPDQVKRWLPLAERRLTRVRLGEQTHEDTAIELSQPARHDRYRLTLRDRDNPPLAVKGVGVEGVVYEALFLPDAGREYRLYYGGEKTMRRPEYDLGVVLGQPETAAAVDCVLGAAQANESYSAGRGGVSGKAVLVAAVLAMLAALGWVLVRSVRGLEKRE